MILEEFNREKYEEDLWNQAKEEGKAEGKVEGRIEEKRELLVQLYRENLLTLEQAAEKYGTTVEEFRKLL